ncbi:hypothetical protein ACB098_12G174900 [Castanea mollissima]
MQWALLKEVHSPLVPSQSSLLRIVWFRFSMSCWNIKRPPHFITSNPGPMGVNSISICRIYQHLLDSIFLSIPHWMIEQWDSNSAIRDTIQPHQILPKSKSH